MAAQATNDVAANIAALAQSDIWTADLASGGPGSLPWSDGELDATTAEADVGIAPISDAHVGVAHTNWPCATVLAPAVLVLTTSPARFLVQKR